MGQFEKTWLLTCLTALGCWRRGVRRQAILVKRNSGSAWHVTFAPLHGADGDEIKVKVSRVRLEQMSFSAPYTLADIERLREPDDA